MSEQKEAGKEKDQERRDQQRPELEDEAHTDSASAGSAARPPSGRSNAPAWLALLLALAAAGLAGWQWWLSRTDDESGPAGSRIEQQASAIASHSQRLDQLAERLGGVESQLDGLDDRLGSPGFDPAALQREIQSLTDADSDIRQQMSSLSERLDQAVSNLESQLDDVIGRLESLDFDPAALRREIQSLADADSNIRQEMSSLSERLEQAVSSLESQLDDVIGRLESLDFDPAALRREIQSLTATDNEIRQRVSSVSERLEQAVSNLEAQLEQVGAERSDRIEESVAEARFRLGLVEVAGFLRLGESRAELSADVAGAISAYRRAQSRLEALEDGRTEPLRQLIEREIEALQSVQSTDFSTLAGRLSALESEAAQWPLAGPPEQDLGERPAEEAGEQPDGWWAGVRASLDGLVRVTPRESAPLSSAALESVRERVRLHLAGAQAAAARRSIDELVLHLKIAEELVRGHFDTSAETVSRALEFISEAASVNPPPLPELGSALAEAERQLAQS